MDGCSMVENILNIITVVFIAREDLHEIVESIRAWKSPIDLSVKSNEFSPGHDGDFFLGLSSEYIGGLFEVACFA